MAETADWKILHKQANVKCRGFRLVNTEGCAEFWYKYVWAYYCNNCGKWYDPVGTELKGNPIFLGSPRERSVLRMKHRVVGEIAEEFYEFFLNSDNIDKTSEINTKEKMKNKLDSLIAKYMGR